MGDISMKPDADVALGISMLNSCLEGSTSYQTKYIARYCLTDSSPYASNPGTMSRCSSPSGQIASESDRFAQYSLYLPAVSGSKDKSQAGL